MRVRLIFVLLALTAAVSCADCSADGVRQSFTAALYPAPSAPRYTRMPPEAPDGGCTRLKVNGIGGPIGRVFSDLNAEHLKYAVPQGIKPISDCSDAWYNSAGLVKIESDSCMYIDSLTHSYPYLTMSAAELLHDIAHRFRQELRKRGGGDYRIKVTSVLRTDATLSRLRKVNRNASSQSAHAYGTTFDISYAKFICDNPDGVRRTFEDLKNLLAEIVADLRNEGRCKVKHERRQACLHITAIAQALE